MPKLGTDFFVQFEGQLWSASPALWQERVGQGAFQTIASSALGDRGPVVVNSSSPKYMDSDYLATGRVVVSKDPHTSLARANVFFSTRLPQETIAVLRDVTAVNFRRLNQVIIEIETEFRGMVQDAIEDMQRAQPEPEPEPVKIYEVSLPRYLWKPSRFGWANCGHGDVYDAVVAAAKGERSPVTVRSRRERYGSLPCWASLEAVVSQETANLTFKASGLDNPIEIQVVEDDPETLVVAIDQAEFDFIRRLGSPRPVEKPEDPRDQKIRDLEAKVRDLEKMLTRTRQSRQLEIDEVRKLQTRVKLQAEMLGRIKADRTAQFDELVRIKKALAELIEE